jgi:hypothetical protein
MRIAKPMRIYKNVTAQRATARNNAAAEIFLAEWQSAKINTMPRVWRMRAERNAPRRSRRIRVRHVVASALHISAVLLVSAVAGAGLAWPSVVHAQNVVTGADRAAF